MRRTGIQKPIRADDVPKDLRDFEERLSYLGVEVRLPTVGVNDPLHPLEEVDGELLSETIIRLRRGA